jgi:hypothetical protein
MLWELLLVNLVGVFAPLALVVLWIVVAPVLWREERVGFGRRIALGLILGLNILLVFVIVQNLMVGPPPYPVTN